MKQLIQNIIIAQLWQFVAKVVKNDQPYIIGVTGSVGKTLTKFCLASVLAATKKKVIYTGASFNTEFGIPLSLLGYKEAPTGVLGWLSVLARAKLRKSLKVKNYYLILEYGADKPGDIEFLAKRLPPDLVVLTSIAPTHLVTFKTEEAVAREKLKLVALKKPKAKVIANIDDHWQKKSLSHESQVLWYGIDSRFGKVRASNVQVSPQGTRFTFSYGPERRELSSNLLGKHQIYSLLAAASGGMTQKVSFSDTCKILEKIEARPGRMKLITGKREIQIIDDSYNSSPKASKAALDVLQTFKLSQSKKHRRVVILGNMNELGEAEVQYHRELGEYVFGRADALVAVGPNAQIIAQGAVSKGMKPETIITFSTPDELIQRLDDVINRGDIILLKASQNKMRFERIVKALMLNPEKSDKILVRQAKYWQKR